ncbi:MAG: alpha hydrolase [Methanomicrobiaceae archaeon]|nr:alpha hydrolase [Methanomicrobiaceae archaeon]
MKAGVLFSGGKDSAMAAIMLSRDYEVELNTFVFDPSRRIAPVERAAAALGFPLRTHAFGIGMLEDVGRLVVQHGYPNDALNTVHLQAVTTLCSQYEVVGDGTRLNDRIPRLSRGEVQQIEARSGSSYVRPLLGFGKKEVDRISQKYLDVQIGESGEIENGDYENEIREALGRQGIDISAFFPPRHLQSLVTGIK